MRGVVLAAGAVGLAWLAACGGGSQMMMDVPVKQQPLTGKINGTTFTAVSATASGMTAVATGAPAGSKWVEIYDSPIDCSTAFPDPTRKVIITVPWQVTSYDFTLKQNATLFYLDDAGVSQNVAAFDGRAEIISAPDAGTATIRVRANGNASNTVEGEVQVQVCD